jgi:hypothetical protein
MGNEAKIEWDTERQLNALGYEQVDGSHYASDSIAAPVANPITVQTVRILYCMNRTWTSAIIDVEGAFFQGCFANGEELYIEVPDGFHEWYKGDIVLRMTYCCMGQSKLLIVSSRHSHRE